MKYKRFIIIILVLGLVGFIIILNACGISPEDQTEVTVNISKEVFNSANNQAQRSEQVVTPGPSESSTVVYHLLVKVTAPELAKPLIYTKLNYEPGTDFKIYVPNGKKRTFDVLIYEEIKSNFLFDMFPAILYLPPNPPSERTFDLIGKPLILDITVQALDPYSLPSIGTDENGKGKILMEMPDGTIQPVPSCSTTDYVTAYVNAYFRDLEFKDLRMGPITLPLPYDAIDPTLTGYYFIQDIPFGRTYVLEFEQPVLGWFGATEPFTLPSDTAIHPLDVILTGFQPFAPPSVIPEALFVKNGDTSKTYIFQIQFKGGWGACSVESDFWNYVEIYPENPVLGEYSYRPLMSMGDSISDTIRIKLCEGSSIKLMAYWYMAPDITSVSPDRVPTNLSCYPLTLTIQGKNFDTTNAEVWIDNTPISPSTLLSSTITIDLTSPLSAGTHQIKVRNPRSNPNYPDFKGFEDTYNMLFSDTAPCPQ